MNNKQIILEIGLVFFFFTLLFNVETFGQTTYEIKNAGIEISIPNKWTYGGSEINDSIRTEYFDREAIPYKYRNYKQKLSAIVAISYENVKSVDAVSYSASKRLSNPFEVTKVMSLNDLEMQIENGVAYEGTYADYVGIHTIYVIHMIVGSKGITVFCDITDDLFEKIKPEFDSILKSIKEVRITP